MRRSSGGPILIPIRQFATLALAATIALQAGAEGRFEAQIASVEALRGKKFTAEVKHETIERAELRTFLRAQIERDLLQGTDGYLDALKALYLVDGAVTIDPLLDLYDAQVLAFYDPAKHVYYALDEPPSGIPMPAVMVEAVQVHELMHALQDQAFGAGARTISLQADWDAALAYQSLLEGEATLVMLAHLGEKMGADLETMIAQEGMVDALRDAAERGDSIPAGIPRYFVDSLQFPYVDGLVFVLDAYRAGGWKALDAIHANPPVSTEEILRPELYRERVAGTGRPAHATAEATGSELLRTVLGEFHWRFLLGEDAGEGWESDRVVVRRGKGGATVMVDSSWDSAADAGEFAEAIGPLLEEKGAPNVRIATLGARVIVAWGADAKAIRKFVPAAGRPR
ncbi:MAG: hypothetical protein HYU52_18300 [Acidobacteria bacterium]|nr:hypothetical protein [Acidobacteriota bacterium]